MRGAAALRISGQAVPANRKYSLIKGTQNASGGDMPSLQPPEELEKASRVALIARSAHRTLLALSSQPPGKGQVVHWCLLLHERQDGAHDILMVVGYDIGISELFCCSKMPTKIYYKSVGF